MGGLETPFPTRMIGTTMRNPSIVRQTRWNPVGLILIAILVLPFALHGKTSGLVFTGVVWVVIAALLLRWWRTRNDPRPPSHSV